MDLVGLDQIHLHSGELGRIIERDLLDRADPGAEARIDEIFLDLLDSLPLGWPFTFRQQHGGALVQEVRPAENHEDELSSRGRVELNLHTDDVFLEPSVRPQHIALLGVYNPERVPTQLVRLDDVIRLLEPTTIAVLSQPLFTFACPPSFDVDRRADLRTDARPILRKGAGGGFEVGLPASTTEVVKEAKIDADVHLQSLRSAIEDAPRTEFTLSAGEILIFSNSRCLHGRPPVVDADRWLKRIYLRHDLASLELAAATDSRNVYDAVKAFRYGRSRGREGAD
ncbi:MAG TPA: TauD/TfdA family dioxygenase [Solirubrobacterales bacterium]|nr:TauD/TfdA family dioxygenase [Solirubrobacterales bacterium]